jgi:hypothetical protein
MLILVFSGLAFALLL